MPQEARFSVSFLRNIFHYTASLGFDLEELCAAARIPRALLNSPDELLPGSAIERAWTVCLARTADPDLGLHLGEAVHPSVLGLLGFAMLSCETLGGAIEKMARYWNLMSDATTIHLHQNGAQATLTLAVLDLPGNFLLHNRHPVESSLSAALAITGSLAGRPLPLLAVSSTFASPPDTREYVRIFGRLPYFSAPSTQLSFPAAALAWPVLQANPAMLQALEGQIQSRLQAAPQSITEHVRHQLALQLRGQLPSLASVARALHKSERALQRELQLEGATFRQVLDQIRADLASSYLQNPAHSITDVSFLLGFSEPSVFHRSFRKWTGLTPQAFRRGL